MIKRLLTLCLALLATTSMASGEGATILKKLTKAITEIASYSVEFAVEVEGEELLSGSYTVSGEDYMINIGSQCIIGGNGERMTVDHVNKEIVCERIDESSPMLMVNPSKAFKSLDTIFNATVIKQESNSVTLELKPRSKESIFDAVTLEVQRQSNLPQSVTYSVDGEKATIKIESILPFSGDLVLPDNSALYEMIDLR